METTNVQALGAIKIKRLTGNKKMPELDAKVIDFWRWTFSDLMMNTARGVLAEFIVAQALGISTEGVQAGWNPFDLVTEVGIKIEVKSASYIQSWAHNEYSKIQFSLAPKRGWDFETNKQADEAARHADYYVFALLAGKDQSRIDPTNVSQWRFWMVEREFLDKRPRSQHSITLGSLKREVHEEGLDFERLSRESRRIQSSRMGTTPGAVPEMQGTELA